MSDARTSAAKGARDAVLIRRVSNGYIVSSAVQAPGDEQVYMTLDEVKAYLTQRFEVQG